MGDDSPTALANLTWFTYTFSQPSNRRKRVENASQAACLLLKPCSGSHLTQRKAACLQGHVTSFPAVVSLTSLLLPSLLLILLRSYSLPCWSLLMASTFLPQGLCTG